MKKVSLYLSIVALSAFLASCTVITPISASSAPIGNKVGTSQTGILFGFIYLNKNYGINEAARNGKIKSGVATVDEKIRKIPLVSIFFYKKEVIVSGN